MVVRSPRNSINRPSIDKLLIEARFFSRSVERSLILNPGKLDSKCFIFLNNLLQSLKNDSFLTIGGQKKFHFEMPFRGEIQFSAFSVI